MDPETAERFGSEWKGKHRPCCKKPVG